MGVLLAARRMTKEGLPDTLADSVPDTEYDEDSVMLVVESTDTDSVGVSLIEEDIVNVSDGVCEIVIEPLAEKLSEAVGNTDEVRDDVVETEGDTESLELTDRVPV